MPFVANGALSADRADAGLSTLGLGPAADGVHSAVHLIASLAVLIGLRLSTHKTRAFPCGLYKAHNLAEAVVALPILVAGYQITGQVTFLSPPPYVVASIIAAIVTPIPSPCIVPLSVL